MDKSGVAAGASGIACGVIRNNYFQPAMQELMAACVEIWESDPEGLSYHGSGYVALGPPAQEEELAEVFERQQQIGYPSELHTGEDEVVGPHAGPVRRLARGGSDGLPPRASRRLRLQPRVDARSGRQGSSGRRIHSRGGRGHWLLDRRLGSRGPRRDECRRDPGRPGRRRRRPLDRLALGDARPARPHRRSPAGRLGGARFADVDVLVPAGGRGGAPALDARDRRPARVAGAARRLTPPPDRRRREAGHRSSPGAST